MITLLVCAVVAALFPAAHAQPRARDRQTERLSLQKLYDSALRFQKAGSIDRAGSKYRVFLADAQGELAAEYAAAGDFGRAATLFKAALRLQPDSAVLRLGYAKTALLMGNPALAKKLSRRFLDDDLGGFDQIAQAHQLLGRALHKMNRDQEARNELQEAVNLDPSFANRYDLAVICLDLDDGKCASQTFQGIEKAFGDKPAIHMRIGLAYGDSDFVPRAVPEFRKVIAEDPRFPGAHYALAAALLSLGNDAKNVPEAEAQLRKEIAISPNSFLAYAALGKLAATNHRYGEALSDLEKATALNPSNPDAFLYLGQLYFDTNRPANAEAALRKAIALTTNPSRNRYQIQKAYFLLGRVLMQEHRPQQAHAEMKLAQQYANKSLSYDKSELAGLLRNSALTTSHDRSNRSDDIATSSSDDTTHPAARSVEAYEHRLTPAIANSYNNLGVIAATGKQYFEAVGFFQDAAKWNPNFTGLDLNWGRAAFMASKFSEAIPPLSRYARTHPADANIRGALAMSQFMTGDYKGCVQTFKAVEKKLSSIPQMEYVFAESLVKTGENSAGEQRLKALEAAHPKIAEVHRAMGELLDSEDQRQGAAKELNVAIKLNPMDPRAHFDLGKLDVETGKAAAAILELKTAVQLLPNDASFHRELAAAYNLESRKQDAEKQLAICRELKGDPPHPEKGPAVGQAMDIAR